MDPIERARLGQRIDFRGRGAGSRNYPAFDRLHHLSLWLALVVSICAACSGLVIGGLWFLMARDEPEHHPWVSPEEVSYISAGLPHATRNAESQSLPWRSILGSKNVWVVTASYFGFGYVAYIFLHLVLHLSEHSPRSESEASAVYSMLPFAAMAACSSLGGWISDHLTRTYGKRVGRCLTASAATGSCRGFRWTWGLMWAMPGWPAWFSPEERVLCIWRRVLSGRSVLILAAVRRGPFPE